MLSVLDIVEGMVAAFGCVVVTVLAIYGSMAPQSAIRYVPMTYLTLGLNLCALVAILTLKGWTIGTIFTIAFAVLSLLPIFLLLINCVFVKFTATSAVDRRSDQKIA
jgi:hypothetical protein